MSDRKVALVIHGMDGLGTSICRRLQRDGYVVAATAPPHACLPAAWAAAQRDEGFSFQAWCVDIGEPAECAGVVDKLLAHHGRLDVLVHVAATAPAGAENAQLGDLSHDRWRAALRIVLDGAFHINKEAVVPMLHQGWGRIIQVAAAPAWARAGALGEAAANAGLHGLGKALALEVARHGVTVNTIAPGCLRADGVMQEAAAIPVGRLGEAAEVAALVSYLASDSAGFITGAQLAINGGQHMC